MPRVVVFVPNKRCARALRLRHLMQFAWFHKEHRGRFNQWSYWRYQVTGDPMGM